MLIASNRHLVAGSLSRSFEPAGSALVFADARPSAGGWTLVDAVADVDDDAARARLLPLFAGTEPVLVYLHGFNNTPATCFERCALLQSLYSLPVIGFSWPAEGRLADGNPAPGATPAADEGDEDALQRVKRDNRDADPIRQLVQRYRHAKVNAQNSGDALARLLRLVAAARLQAGRQPHTVAAHSLGAHLLQHALGVPHAAEALGAATNVALLAACTRAAGHAAWLANVRPQGRAYVTFNRGDNVLFGARVADGNEPKLGAEPGDLLAAPTVRYVSFTDAAVGKLGHRYFARKGMNKATRHLFKRIFRSHADIEPGETPFDTYPVGCDADLRTCSMHAPLQPDLA